MQAAEVICRISTYRNNVLFSTAALCLRDHYDGVTRPLAAPCSRYFRIRRHFQRI